MAEQEITIYRHPNREMRSFLMPVELIPPRVEYFTKPIGTESRAALAQLGQIGDRTVREILSLPDVASLWINPKEIRVKKEASASWEGLEEKILLVLNRSLRRKAMRVVR